MTMPALPAKGATDWYNHYAGMDAAVRSAVPAAGDSTISGSKTLNGPTQLMGRTGFNTTDASARQPFRTFYAINGANGTLGGTGDVVAHGYNALATGDYTGIGGSNPGYFWGENLFATTGTGNADGNGITTYMGSLIEATMRSGSGATIGNVIALMAEAGFMSASAGANVGQMTSLKVGAPKRKEGAVAGTAGKSHGIYMEGVAASAVGASEGYGIYIESNAGISATTDYAIFTNGSARVRFGGNLIVGGDLQHSATTLSMYAGTATADSARLQLRTNAVDGYANLALPGTGAKFNITNGSSNVFEFFRDTGLFTGRRARFSGNAAGEQVFVARGVASQTADILRVEDSSTNARSRFTGDGAFVTRAGAPADATLANGELSFYVVSTAGAPRLGVKLKDSAGTIYDALWEIA